MKHYKMLALMVLLHFVYMYAIMYVTVNSTSNIFLNLNRFYVTGLMTLPMVIMEILMMKAMYPDKKLNLLIITGTVITFITLFAFVRQQAFISDRQFLKGMIPHHAGAILMCKESAIEDPEIKELCKSIIESQEREIGIMKAKLQEIEK